MELGIWEKLALGAIALGVLFWFGPGIKHTMEMSRNAESDWMGVLVPVACVIAFVIFLVKIT